MLYYEYKFGSEQPSIEMCKEKRRQAKGSKMTLVRETALRKSEAYPTRSTENQWSRKLISRVEN